MSLDITKMEMRSSAWGLAEAIGLPSLGKAGMRRKGYGVNTDLIYMNS